MTKRVSRNALRVVRVANETRRCPISVPGSTTRFPLRPRVRAVVEGMLGPNADRRLVEESVASARGIRHAWVASAKSFLQIGRTLLRIEAEVPRAVFDQFIHEQRVLPFGRASATKMMSVARAVDLGRIER